MSRGRCPASGFAASIRCALSNTGGRRKMCFLMIVCKSRDINDNLVGMREVSSNADRYSLYSAVKLALCFSSSGMRQVRVSLSVLAVVAT